MKSAYSVLLPASARLRQAYETEAHDLDKLQRRLRVIFRYLQNGVADVIIINNNFSINHKKLLNLVIYLQFIFLGDKGINLSVQVIEGTQRSI